MIGVDQSFNNAAKFVRVALWQSFVKIVSWLRYTTRHSGSFFRTAARSNARAGFQKKKPSSGILRSHLQQQIRVPFIIMGKGPESATNTSCYVQVLGVGTDTGCTVPSALLFFDRQRYLFNVGEGFQRFCVEHKIKLTKISSILATRVTTEATGGLPGMLLTMADTTAGGLLSGHAQLTLHGPPGLHTLVNGFRTFVNVKDLGLKVSEFGTGATKKPNKRAPPEVPKALQENESKSGVTEKEFSDLPECEIVEYPAVKNDSVSITPIVLRPSKLKSRNEDIREPKTKRAKIDANGSINTDNDSGQNHVSAMDVTSVDIESAVACYACELPDIPGKFLPQKAASLGVPRGPLYGKLTRGEEVTAVNGRTVKPEDVMEPSTPGPIVLVIDCPSEAFLPSLANEESGVAFWSSDPSKKNKGKILKKTS